MTEASAQFFTALDQFHFLRPWWLLAIVPILALAWFMYRRRLHEGAWQRVISPHLLPFLLQGYTGSTQRAPIILLTIGWVVGCIALAGPTWRTLPQPVEKHLHAQVIVFDLSLSMYADDLKPSRLDRARFKLRDILEQSRESLTGLVVYAGTSHVVTPLTDDTNTIINMINGLSPDIMPVKGSNPLEAVDKARELMVQAGINDGHIILMADDLDAGFAARAQTIINTQRMPISILAIGTQDGAPIRLPDGNLLRSAQGAIVVPGTPINLMRQAARSLDGRFAELSADNRDIDHILGLRTALLDGDRPQTEREFDVWHEAGPMLLILLLPLVAAGYRRGWLGVILVCLLPGLLLAPTQAQARPLEYLWQTPDQQGLNAWKEGNFERAQEHFRDPLWKGGAAYRAGNWEEAARHFEQDNSALAHYNRGNALARQGELEQALAAYDQALTQNPDLEDAVHNRSIIEQLLEQQSEQDDQSGEGDPQDQQESQQGDQDASDEDQQQGASGGEDDDQTDNSQQPDTQDQAQNDEQQEGKPDQPDQDQAHQDLPEQQDQSGADADQKPTENLDELEQAREQWLRRVPDDPGGLLRNKFMQESRLRRQNDMKGEAW